MRRLTAALLLGLVCCGASAQTRKQSMDEFIRAAQASLDSFVQHSEQEIEDFRRRNNEAYAAFLQHAWEWFEGQEAKSAPVLVRPVILPLDIDILVEDAELPVEDVIVPDMDIAIAPMPIPVPENSVPGQDAVSGTFHGASFSVRIGRDDLPVLRDLSGRSISMGWKRLATENFDNMLHDLMSLRGELDLCDWGYLQLTESFVSAIYGQERSPEAVLLTAFILCQSGYSARLASDRSGGLHYLTEFDCDIYRHPYWNISGRHFYLLDGSDPGSLSIMTEDFAGVKPVRLQCSTAGRFPEDLSAPRTIRSSKYPDVSVTLSVNRNLISFMDTCPVTYCNDDPLTKWVPYARTSVSTGALYDGLKPLVAGKAPETAVAMLLDFVQTGFQYEYDDVVWGDDRVFFADETLYYPYCDCEDRAILLGRMVRDLLGLDTVLVYYPGHLATAVRFPGHVRGDYLTIDGQRYTICDPTYIGAPIGLSMPGLAHNKAVAIRF